MVLELKGRMIMIEEGWSSVVKGNYVWVTNTFSTGVSISVQEWMEVKSMIDLVLVKRDMLHYIQGVRVVRGLGRGFSNKRRNVVVGARRIRSEKLREH